MKTRCSPRAKIWIAAVIAVLLLVLPGFAVAQSVTVCDAANAVPQVDGGTLWTDADGPGALNLTTGSLCKYAVSCSDTSLFVELVSWRMTPIASDNLDFVEIHLLHGGYDAAILTKYPVAFPLGGFAIPNATALLEVNYRKDISQKPLGDGVEVVWRCVAPASATRVLTMLPKFVTGVSVPLITLPAAATATRPWSLLSDVDGAGTEAPPAATWGVGGFRCPSAADHIWLNVTAHMNAGKATQKLHISAPDGVSYPTLAQGATGIGSVSTVFTYPRSELRIDSVTESGSSIDAKCVAPDLVPATWHCNATLTNASVAVLSDPDGTGPFLPVVCPRLLQCPAGNFVRLRSVTTGGTWGFVVRTSDGRFESSYEHASPSQAFWDADAPAIGKVVPSASVVIEPIKTSYSVSRSGGVELQWDCVNASLNSTLEAAWFVQYGSKNWSVPANGSPLRMATDADGPYLNANGDTALHGTVYGYKWELECADPTQRLAIAVNITTRDRRTRVYIRAPSVTPALDDVSTLAEVTPTLPNSHGVYSVPMNFPEDHAVTLDIRMAGVASQQYGIAVVAQCTTSLPPTAPFKYTCATDPANRVVYSDPTKAIAADPDGIGPIPPIARACYFQLQCTNPALPFVHITHFLMDLGRSARVPAEDDAYVHAGRWLFARYPTANWTDMPFNESVVDVTVSPGTLDEIKGVEIRWACVSEAGRPAVWPQPNPRQGLVDGDLAVVSYGCPQVPDTLTGQSTGRLVSWMPFAESVISWGALPCSKTVTCANASHHLNASVLVFPPLDGSTNFQPTYPSQLVVAYPIDLAGTPTSIKLPAQNSSLYIAANTMTLEVDGSSSALQYLSAGYDVAFRCVPNAVRRVVEPCDQHLTSQEGTRVLVLSDVDGAGPILNDQLAYTGASRCRFSLSCAEAVSAAGEDLVVAVTRLSIDAQRNYVLRFNDSNVSTDVELTSTGEKTSITTFSSALVNVTAGGTTATSNGFEFEWTCVARPPSTTFAFGCPAAAPPILIRGDQWVNVTSDIDGSDGLSNGSPAPQNCNREVRCIDPNATGMLAWPHGRVGLGGLLLDPWAGELVTTDGTSWTTFALATGDTRGYHASLKCNLDPDADMSKCVVPSPIVTNQNQRIRSQFDGSMGITTIPNNCTWVVECPNTDDILHFHELRGNNELDARNAVQGALELYPPNGGIVYLAEKFDFADGLYFSNASRIYLRHHSIGSVTGFDLRWRCIPADAGENRSVAEARANVHGCSNGDEMIIERRSGILGEGAWNITKNPNTTFSMKYMDPAWSPRHCLWQFKCPVGYQSGMRLAYHSVRSQSGIVFSFYNGSASIIGTSNKSGGFVWLGPFPNDLRLIYRPGDDPATQPLQYTIWYECLSAEEAAAEPPQPHCQCNNDASDPLVVDDPNVVIGSDPDAGLGGLAQLRNECHWTLTCKDPSHRVRIEELAYGLRCHGTCALWPQVILDGPRTRLAFGTDEYVKLPVPIETFGNVTLPDNSINVSFIAPRTFKDYAEGFSLKWSCDAGPVTVASDLTILNRSVIAMGCPSYNTSTMSWAGYMRDAATSNLSTGLVVSDFDGSGPMETTAAPSSEKQSWCVWAVSCPDPSLFLRFQFWFHATNALTSAVYIDGEPIGRQYVLERPSMSITWPGSRAKVSKLPHDNGIAFTFDCVPRQIEPFFDAVANVSRNVTVNCSATAPVVVRENTTVWSDVDGQGGPAAITDGRHCRYLFVCRPGQWATPMVRGRMLGSASSAISDFARLIPVAPNDPRLPSEFRDNASTSLVGAAPAFLPDLTASSIAPVDSTGFRASAVELELLPLQFVGASDYTTLAGLGFGFDVWHRCIGADLLQWNTDDTGIPPVYGCANANSTPSVALLQATTEAIVTGRRDGNMSSCAWEARCPAPLHHVRFQRTSSVATPEVLRFAGQALHVPSLEDAAAGTAAPTLDAVVTMTAAGAVELRSNVRTALVTLERTASSAASADVVSFNYSCAPPPQSNQTYLQPASATIRTVVGYHGVVRTSPAFSLDLTAPPTVPVHDGSVTLRCPAAAAGETAASEIVVKISAAPAGGGTQGSMSIHDAGGNQLDAFAVASGRVSESKTSTVSGMTAVVKWSFTGGLTLGGEIEYSCRCGNPKGALACDGVCTGGSATAHPNSCLCTSYHRERLCTGNGVVAPAAPGNNSIAYILDDADGQPLPCTCKCSPPWFGSRCERLPRIVPPTETVSRSASRFTPSASPTVTSTKPPTVTILPPTPTSSATRSLSASESATETPSRYFTSVSQSLTVSNTTVPTRTHQPTRSRDKVPTPTVPLNVTVAPVIPATAAPAAQAASVASTTAVVASAAAAGPAAADLQLLGLSGLVSCGDDAFRASAEGASQTILPLAIGDGPGRYLWGFVVILGSLSIAHYGLVQALVNVKPDLAPTAEVAAARLKFPSVTIVIANLAAQGLAFESINNMYGETQFASAVGVACLGMCGGLVGVIVVVRRQLGPLKAVPYPDDIIARVPAVLRWGAPKWRWTPLIYTGRFGSVFNAYVDGKSHFVYVVLVRSIVLAMIAALRAPNVDMCRLQFGFLSFVTVVFVVIISVHHPFRAPGRTIPTAITGLVAALVFITPAIDAWREEIAPAIFAYASMVSTAMTLFQLLWVVVEMWMKRALPEYEKDLGSFLEWEAEQAAKDKLAAEAAERARNGTLEDPLLVVPVAEPLHVSLAAAAPNPLDADHEQRMRTRLRAEWEAEERKRRASSARRRDGQEDSFSDAGSSDLPRVGRVMDGAVYRYLDYALPPEETAARHGAADFDPDDWRPFADDPRGRIAEQTETSRPLIDGHVGASNGDQPTFAAASNGGATNPLIRASDPSMLRDPFDLPNSAPSRAATAASLAREHRSRPLLDPASQRRGPRSLANPAFGGVASHTSPVLGTDGIVAEYDAVYAHPSAALGTRSIAKAIRRREDARRQRDPLPVGTGGTNADRSILLDRGRRHDVRYDDDVDGAVYSDDDRGRSGSAWSDRRPSRSVRSRSGLGSVKARGGDDGDDGDDIVSRRHGDGGGFSALRESPSRIPRGRHGAFADAAAAVGSTMEGSDEDDRLLGGGGSGSRRHGRNKRRGRWNASTSPALRSAGEREAARYDRRPYSSSDEAESESLSDESRSLRGDTRRRRSNADYTESNWEGDSYGGSSVFYDDDNRSQFTTRSGRRR